MGLDNFAARGPDEELTEEDMEAFGQADINLCGGVLSGPPDSFRGKVYDDLIRDITRESLYQEWIPPERVKKMYQALMKCDPKEVAEGDDKTAIINFRKFFKVCADRNLGLMGWW